MALDTPVLLWMQYQWYLYDPNGLQNSQRVLMILVPLQNISDSYRNIIEGSVTMFAGTGWFFILGPYICVWAIRAKYYLVPHPALVEKSGK